MNPTRLAYGPAPSVWYAPSTPRFSARVVVMAGLALLLVAGLLAVSTYYWVQIPFLKFTLAAGQCKGGPPLAGVYLSSRLHVIDGCRSVSGTVDCLQLQPGGEYHVRLR